MLECLRNRLGCGCESNIMPSLPQRFCTMPGCQSTVPCPTHIRERWQLNDARRGTSRQRGYTAAWSKFSKAYRFRHPLCVDPFGLHKGRLVPAECVDHITPLEGGGGMYDEANLQPLCASCHSTKTASEDGGYGAPLSAGNTKRRIEQQTEQVSEE